jgi:beta-carotene hydroxylase
MNSIAKVTTPVWPRPGTEWVTVFLFVGVYLVIGASTALALSLSPKAWPLFVLINSFCVYAAFTVLHEASHRNISRRFPRLEYLMGVMSGLLFHGAYEQFISIHLKHHAKVNLKGQDPDLHATGPITLGKLLQWGATLPVYMQHYFKFGLFRREKFWGIVLPYAFIVCLYSLAWYFDSVSPLLIFWLLPSFLGVMLTVYVFDHLPHHPHSDPGKFTNARFYPHPVLDWVFFMHSHHLIHHLWPSIPWYRYREAYLQRKGELMAAGAHPEVELYGFKDPRS